MKSIKLTTTSGNELSNWHGGSGRAFMSDGTGTGFTSFDFGFRKTLKGEYRLYMGNSKSIALTDEQVAEIGSFAYIEQD